MTAKWDYGGAITRYPIQKGEIWGTALLRVAVHDLVEPELPSFMKEADLVFVDPPWNRANCNSFITKAEQTNYRESYFDFCKDLLRAIEQIAPMTIYMEMGKQYLPWWHETLAKHFARITFYNSTYYHRRLCYVIRASQKPLRHDIKHPSLDGMDEEEIIKWVCENESYNCIADPCMGRGLVGRYALQFGKLCVGTELNPKRLACLLEAVQAERLIAG